MQHGNTNWTDGESGAARPSLHQQTSGTHDQVYNSQLNGRSSLGQFIERSTSSPYTGGVSTNRGLSDETWLVGNELLLDDIAPHHSSGRKEAEKDELFVRLSSHDTPRSFASDLSRDAVSERGSALPSYDYSASRSFASTTLNTLVSAIPSYMGSNQHTFSDPHVAYPELQGPNFASTPSLARSNSGFAYTPKDQNHSIRLQQSHDDKSGCLESYHHVLSTSSLNHPSSFSYDARRSLSTGVMDSYDTPHFHQKHKHKHQADRAAHPDDSHLNHNLHYTVINDGTQSYATQPELMSSLDEHWHDNPVVPSQDPYLANNYTNQVSYELQLRNFKNMSMDDSRTQSRFGLINATRQVDGADIHRSPYGCEVSGKPNYNNRHNSTASRSSTNKACSSKNERGTNIIYSTQQVHINELTHDNNGKKYLSKTQYFTDNAPQRVLYTPTGTEVPSYAPSNPYHPHDTLVKGKHHHQLYAGVPPMHESGHTAYWQQSGDHVGANNAFLLDAGDASSRLQYKGFVYETEPIMLVTGSSMNTKDDYSQRSSTRERGGRNTNRRTHQSIGASPTKRTSETRTNSVPVCPLLEEFRQSRNKDWTIINIRGNIAAFCQDQNGSRFIQQRLEMRDFTEHQLVMDEVLPAMETLRNDVFGNYVVQKLLDFGTPETKNAIRQTLVGKMLQLSLQMYGCRVVQKALEALPEQELPYLLSEFSHNVLSCIYDQNGNHVIQKCIEVLCKRAQKALNHGENERATYLLQHIDFVVKDVITNASSLSCHPYGCRVLQRILEYCNDFKKAEILNEITHSHRKLLDDQYGNYVIQHVIQFGRDCDRDSVLGIVIEYGLLSLSKQKFASNVVEKLLKYGNANHRKAVIREMLKVADDPSSIASDGKSSIVLLMVRDAFANYVVQTTLDVISESEEKQLLLKELNAHADELRNYTFAKHIVAKLSTMS